MKYWVGKLGFLCILFFFFSKNVYSFSPEMFYWNKNSPKKIARVGAKKKKAYRSGYLSASFFLGPVCGTYMRRNTHRSLSPKHISLVLFTFTCSHCHN